MKYFISLTFCILSFYCFSQTKGWKYYTVSKDFKLKLPIEAEKLTVRELEIHQIQEGNYDWKIIVMPLNSFLKDDPTVNFLGKVKNLSNNIQSDPYLELLSDSIFSLNGNHAYFSKARVLNATDTSQSKIIFQFFIKNKNQVYISNLKYHKESLVKLTDVNNYFSSIKISEAEVSDSLYVLGEESYFISLNKKQFLKKAYCNLPKIEKTKSYHRLFSMRVDFYLTETGKVSAVNLENDKMILITRGTETRLQNYFSKFTFKEIKNKLPSKTMRYSFVLYLTDYSKKLFCD